MKRITVTILSLCLASFGGLAQGRLVEKFDKVQQDNNFRNSLWSQSHNVAGLSFKPLKEYNSLDLRYDGQYGDFRPQQQGNEINDVSLNTGGVVKLGKFLLSGDFAFRNIFENGTKYNAIKYEIGNNMPYYVADTITSNWKKQEYDLDAKISSPVLWDHVSFGFSIDYITKVGAKQMDPRCETYKYNIEAIPSVAVSLGEKHILGIWALYNDNKEKSSPSLNNYSIDKKIFFTKGLGIYTNGKVGGNDGLKDCWWKGQKFGAGLQYGFSNDNLDLLADFGYTVEKVDAMTNISLPQRLGTSDRSDISGNVQMLWGDFGANKLTIDGLYSTTKGTEYVQKLNTEAFNQQWDVITSNVMSTFDDVYATVAYDHQFGANDKRGYDWKVGGEAGFSSISDLYEIQTSSFDATSVHAFVNGAKQLKFKQSAIVIALETGYEMSLSGDYIYGGVAENIVLKDLYTADLVFHTSDWIKAGGNINWTIYAKKVNYFINLLFNYISPIDVDMDRITAKASFGILF